MKNKYQYLFSNPRTTELWLRRIPAGTFTMGSPSGEVGRVSDEAQHTVTLTRDYYMGVFEVTQAQYEAVMGSNPSYFKAGASYGKRPVETVSWDTITASGSGFLAKVSAKSGLTLTLPSEAQWEYACRAGTTSGYSNGLECTTTGDGDDPNLNVIARYWANGGSGYSSSDTTGNVGTAFVGSYAPNAWGLYDMHGNVWEWTLDWYAWNYGTGTSAVTDPTGPGSGSYRVPRGGGWHFSARSCRSAYRGSYSPSNSYDNFGFRVCMPPPPVQ